MNFDYDCREAEDDFGAVRPSRQREVAALYARCEALERERDDIQQRANKLISIAMRVNTECHQEVHRLREALAKFGSHHPACCADSLYEEYRREGCTCGFDKALPGTALKEDKR